MITVPENTIAAICFTDEYRNKLDKVYSSLKGVKTRDWFIKHAYFCLPLVIGNQYGFVMKSLYDVSLFWNGGDSPSDLKITIHDKEEYTKNANLQTFNSHFGMGVVTIQTPFTLRTPPNVNLMTINPPNYFIDGLYHMTGVVECDNLRRDFTFNLRVTRPNFEVRIKKDDIVGCFLPYPRNFIDKYQMVEGFRIFTSSDITEEQQCIKDFGIERSTADTTKPNKNGRRYFKGEDVYGNKFQYLHQKSLSGNNDDE